MTRQNHLFWHFSGWVSKQAALFCHSFDYKRCPATVLPLLLSKTLVQTQAFAKNTYMTILKDLVHIDFCWPYVQNISSSESWHNLFICILFWSSKTQLIVESGFLGGCQSCRKSDLGAHIRECHHQSALVSQAICANEVECLQSAWLAQTQPKKFCNLWWPNDLTSYSFVTTEVLN